MKSQGEKFDHKDQNTIANETNRALYRETKRPNWFDGTVCLSKVYTLDARFLRSFAYLYPGRCCHRTEPNRATTPNSLAHLARSLVSDQEEMLQDQESREFLALVHVYLGVLIGAEDPSRGRRRRRCRMAAAAATEQTALRERDLGVRWWFLGVVVLAARAEKPPDAEAYLLVVVVVAGSTTPGHDGSVFRR